MEYIALEDAGGRLIFKWNARLMEVKIFITFKWWN